MAFIELPIAADTPHQSFSVQLDGALYTVRLRYNTRAGHWILDLFTFAGEQLVAGLALRLGVDLLSQYRSAEMPPGSLFVLNYVDPYAEPDRDNFGQDVMLIYQEAQS